MAEVSRDLDHLYVEGFALTTDFKSKSRGGTKIREVKDREAHGKGLKRSAEYAFRNATVLWQLPKNCGQQARSLSSRVKDPPFRSKLTLLARIHASERVSVRRNGFCFPSETLTETSRRGRPYGCPTPIDNSF